MKKIALMCLALVLTLGTLGVAYAYWNDTLTISGSVATGTFNTDFANITCKDNEIEPPEVGTCKIDILTAKSFKVTIGNGYPCYVCDVTYDIVNNGTIPAKIKSITIGGVAVTTAGQYVDIDLGQTTQKDIRVTLTGISVGTAIPANGDKVTGDLHIHVFSSNVEGSDADQNASGSFTVIIETAQFNAP